MAQRISRDEVLVSGEGTPNARVSLDTVLVAGEGTPNAIVSQITLLVAVDVNINPATITPIVFVST